MPRIVGFSSGCINKADPRSAVNTLQKTISKAIELSSLREHELEKTMEAIDYSTGKFEYMSVHAPSKLINLTERQLVENYLANIKLPIVVHPDIIGDFSIWKSLGSRLFIENMDNRKKTGRTFRELEPIFRELPEARFCFDVAHALQVGSYVELEILRMLTGFADRLAQIHLSTLDSNLIHHELSDSAIKVYRDISFMVPSHVPIILEFEPKFNELNKHLGLAMDIFNND